MVIIVRYNHARSASSMKDSFEANPLSEQFGGQAETQADITPIASKTNPLGIVLALLALYLIWGSTYLGISIAIESIPPLLMIGVRFIVAGGILYLFLRIRGVPNPNRSQWLGSTAVGILLIGGGMGGVATAEQWVPSGVAAVCIATAPLWISLFAGLWGRWPVRSEWLGLGLGFVGVILLNLGSGLWASPLGAIILLISPMCWAFGSAWSHHLQTTIGSDGKRSPDADRRDIRNYHWSDPRTKDNQYAHYAIAPGFVLPDHVWLIDSFLSIWVRSATSASRPRDQLCLCESCCCRVSWGGTGGRNRHSVDDCGDGGNIGWSCVAIAGAY